MVQVMKNSETLGSDVVPPVFVGRWTVQIVNLLKHRPYRHSELQRQLETASQRMLTRTLRNLEATGLIERRVRSHGQPVPLGTAPPAGIAALPGAPARQLSVHRSHPHAYRLSHSIPVRANRSAMGRGCIPAAGRGPALGSAQVSDSFGPRGLA
jgi:hypothetical protein